MSARCTVRVYDSETGPTTGYCFFRHHDGYPDGPHGVLAGLEDVQSSGLVWGLPRFEANEFAAGIIATWKERPGGIRLCNSHNSFGDTEFLYDVTFGEDQDKNGNYMLYVAVYDAGRELLGEGSLDTLRHYFEF